MTLITVQTMATVMPEGTLRNRLRKALHHNMFCLALCGDYYRL